MKKTTTGLKDMKKMMEKEFELAEAERIEQERVAFEHKASMNRQYFYKGSTAPMAESKGWVDSSR